MYKSFGFPLIVFNVRFKSDDLFPIVRRKHFNVTEIFAYVGGLLGLFLGISVISFVELFVALLHPLFKKFATLFSFRENSLLLNCNHNRYFKGISFVKSYFAFYMNESSIHSFNFIANASNCFERIFWLLTFSFSMTGCVFMILQLHRTMDFKAVSLVIDDQVMKVAEIPFPAVTIFASFPSAYKLRFPKIQSFESADDYLDSLRDANGEIVSDRNTFESAAHPTSK